MNTLTSTIALTATLASAHAAFAQHTRIICEASSDFATTWHNSVTVWPGQRVDVRVRFELFEVPVGYTMLGFAGATYQPILTNWRSDLGDYRFPFTWYCCGSPTASCTTCVTPAFDGQQVNPPHPWYTTGRLFPFGATSMGVSSSTGLLTAFVDQGSTLRFSGSRNATPTTLLQWGVGSYQQPPTITGTNFNSTLSPVVFRYAFMTAPRATAERRLVAMVPSEWVHGGVVKWFHRYIAVETWSDAVGPEHSIPAVINVRERCAGDFVGTVLTEPGASPSQYFLPDGSVNADDLLFFLDQFGRGRPLADLDDGSGEGNMDQAVTIEDLLYFLVHFEQGC